MRSGSTRVRARARSAAYNGRLPKGVDGDGRGVALDEEPRNLRVGVRQGARQEAVAVGVLAGDARTATDQLACQRCLKRARMKTTARG